MISHLGGIAYLNDLYKMDFLPFKCAVVISECKACVVGHAPVYKKINKINRPVSTKFVAVILENV